jgi:hypothetical protein
MGSKLLTFVLEKHLIDLKDVLNRVFLVNFRFGITFFSLVCARFDVGSNYAKNYKMVEDDMGYAM